MAGAAPPGLERLVLASGNRGKLAELRALLGGLGIELLAQSDFGIADAEETGLSFVENALIKARHASRLSGLPALADDSGLCVDALGGAPGLHSARYAGPGADDAANVSRLLDALQGVPADRRGAEFVCVLALLRHPADPAPLLACGRWRGSILEQPSGREGFGYDPVFGVGVERSAADLAAAEKHAASHRGQASRALIKQLTV